MGYSWQDSGVLQEDSDRTYAGYIQGKHPSCCILLFHLLYQASTVLSCFRSSTSELKYLGTLKRTQDTAESGSGNGKATDSNGFSTEMSPTQDVQVGKEKHQELDL